MSENPFLRRVLGEADETQAEPEAAWPDRLPLRADPEQELGGPTADEPASMDTSTVPVQELIQLWQSGQKMDVATQLMFTEASYVDLVNLCFAIGQGAGVELGRLLDDLADTENIPVPQPSDGYSSVLQRVAASHQGRSTVPIAPA